MILFAEAAARAFGELSESDKRKAASSIDLRALHPRINPVRRRGLMRSYRYFAAGRHLVYYSVNSQEVRITAIIPGVMGRA